ncbi:MAG: formate--tetrahydrofolate ligase, partial [Tannerellaceae bacterium]
NIAQGTNTIIATRMGMSLSDYVVTEAGFGCDLGAEKFLDIKCREAGISPKAIVLVATIRALKFHGGMGAKDLKTPNVEALLAGTENLAKHIENVKKFKIEPVVAINRFITDTDEEIAALVNWCKEQGVKVSPIEVWAKGGDGAMELAEMVVEAAQSCTGTFEPIYTLDQTPEEKIFAISTEIYGADGVDYTSKAKTHLKRIYDLGLDKLPICMAKTQKSLSDNPNLIGRPTDFNITIREIEIAAGAGFIVPITGDMMRMPGLPEEPAAEKIDIDNNGVITGLF